MNDDHILVIIAKAGTWQGKAAYTVEGLKRLAELNPSPYIKFREEQQDLVWDGPETAYYEMFTAPSAQREAESAIKRAMRKY